MMKDKGITLTELVVAVAILGTLAGALALSYKDWMKQYKVEAATRQFYGDLMLARDMALHRYREHYVILCSGSYSIVEDTDDDGRADAGDRPLPSFPKTVEYPLEWNGSGNKIIFDRRGLIDTNRTVHFSSGAGYEPDYDCMRISRTRIILGRYRADEGECVIDGS